MADVRLIPKAAEGTTAPRSSDPRTSANRALATELIKLSEQCRTAHDCAIDHEEWAVASELITLASAIAALIAKTLRGELEHVS